MRHLRRLLASESDRDSLDDISSHSSLPAVVQPSGSRIGMASEKLYVFQRDALAEEVRDRRHVKRVRRKA